MDPYIDVYFDKLGIEVYSNTLGRTPALVEAYVNDTQDIVDNSTNKLSHHVKHECYSRFYDMPSRKKFTGFEEFSNAAMQFRSAASEFVHRAQNSPLMIVDHVSILTTGSYIDKLKSSFDNFTKPIFLYLSGGLDSEVVARALLDAEVKFTPVIFHWSDGSGNICNSFDTNYALDFCAANSITPVERTIDIESLWKSTEFKDLAIDVGLISAHLTTYVYMIKHMASEFKDVIHLLGGEIRYRSNFGVADKKIANLVTLAKVTPGYNGSTYGIITGITANAGSVQLNLADDGNWVVGFFGAGSTSGSPTTGTWWTPSVLNPTIGSYEYSISDVTIVSDVGGTITPSAPTGYTTIVGSVAACTVSIPDSAAAREAWASFTVDIRLVGQTVPVNSSTITLKALNSV